MELDETYKYLGIEEGEGIYNNQMKEKQGKEYYHSVWQILKMESYSKNRIIAINTLAVPVLVYSFGTVNWLLVKKRS
jgi:IMP cyclohydrolase